MVVGRKGEREQGDWKLIKLKQDPNYYYNQLVFHPLLVDLFIIVVERDTLVYCHGERYTAVIA